MNKLSLFKWATVVLLAINLFLVGFMVLNKPPKHKLPKERIINELEFDNKQVETYEGLISNHKKEIRKIRKSIMKSKRELYGYLNTDSSNSEEIGMLKNKIGNAYTSIENEHFKHFMDIKKLCKKDQLENFNELTEELSKLFSGPPPKRKRRK